MALKIRNIDNAAVFGEIRPGWSVDESATPHVIGDGSASVGGVQLSAAATDISEFAANKAVTFYYEAEGTTEAGNNISGSFDSVNVSGAVADLTASNALSGLVGTRRVQPVAPEVAMQGSVPDITKNLGLSSPRGMDTDSQGNIYIADTTPSNSIYSYTPRGEFIARFPVASNMANIRAISIDRARGWIYVVGAAGVFLKYTLNGNLLFNIEDQQISGSGVAVMPNGDVLVASNGEPGARKYTSGGVFIQTQPGASQMAVDSGNNYYRVGTDASFLNTIVSRHNSSGTQLGTWTIPSNGASLGYGFNHIAVDSAGALYLAAGDSRNTSANVLYKYSTTGTLVWTAVARGATSEDSLSSAFGLTVNPAGEVIIMGGNYIAGRKLSYRGSTVGQLLRTFYTGPRDYSAPVGGYGVASANGYIYVANFAGFAVSQYTTSGQFVRYFGDSGPSSTMSPAPRSVTVDSVGNVYAAAYASPLFKVFTKDGVFIRTVNLVDGTGPGQVKFYTAMKLNPVDSLLYFVEGNRVQKFTTDGTYIGTLPIPTDFGYGNIAFDNTGGIYVFGFSRVVKIQVGETSYATFSLTDVQYTSGNYTDIAVSGGNIYLSANWQQSVGADVILYSGLQVISATTGALVGRRKDFGGRILTTPTGLYGDRGRIITLDSANGSILAEIGQAPTLSTAFEYYVGESGANLPVQFLGSNPDVYYAGWTDSVWTKLNELCAATGKEIVLQNDGLIVRDLVTSTINVEDFEASPATSVDSTSAARYVSIVNQNTSIVNNGVVFDYTDDPGRAISADIGETVTTTIETDVWLTSIQQPVFQNLAGGKYPSDGRFIAYTASGQAIDRSAFLQYGMDLKVALNPDGRSIDVTLIGPFAQVGAFEGPYTVGSLVGDGTRTGISVIGSGVRTNPQDVLIATGADWSKVTTEESQNIDNPFITTAAAVYDRGMWAADALNGVAETISLNLPVWRIGGLGISPGATFVYRKARWRVLSSTVTNTTVRLNAQRYTTVGEHDALYAGQTLGQHDATLAALTLGDSALKPLY